MATIETIIKKNAYDAQGKKRAEVKTYRVRYNYKDPVTGKIKRTSKRGFSRKSDAEAFRQEIETRQANGTFLPPEVVRLGDYLEDWLQAYCKGKLRQSTYADYERIIKQRLIPAFGGLDIKTITSQQIERLYNDLLEHGRMDGKGGLAAKSVLYIHRVFNEAMNHAMKKNLIVRNPVQAVMNTPKPEKFHAEVYSLEDLQKLLLLARDTPYETPIALAGFCGLRRGECLGLQEEQIDFDAQKIHIRHQLVEVKADHSLILGPPKSEESNRVVWVPNVVMEVLRRQIDANRLNKAINSDSYIDEGYIICSDKGAPIRPNYFTHNFSRFIKRIGMKHIRFHDLRHSCASLMLTSGVPMKTASTILGHSSMTITADLYTHVLEDSKREAARLIDEALSNLPN